MREGECKIGQVVKVTQKTKEYGKTGKILKKHGSHALLYFTIEGLEHCYHAGQLDLVSQCDEVNNAYQIY